MSGPAGRSPLQLVASNLSGTWSSPHERRREGGARGHRFEGPVGVLRRSAVPRPPSNRDLLPTRRSKGGDVDKQQRTLLDALTDGGLIRDDSQVVQVEAVT